jgi:hypothetical protein
MNRILHSTPRSGLDSRSDRARRRSETRLCQRGEINLNNTTIHQRHLDGVNESYEFLNAIEAGLNSNASNAMQCNAMQCNAMQCNAMQCNAMQCRPRCFLVAKLVHVLPGHVSKRSRIAATYYRLLDYRSIDRSFHHIRWGKIICSGLFVKKSRSYRRRKPRQQHHRDFCNSHNPSNCCKKVV